MPTDIMLGTPIVISQAAGVLGHNAAKRYFTYRPLVWSVRLPDPG